MATPGAAQGAPGAAQGAPGAKPGGAAAPAGNPNGIDPNLLRSTLVARLHSMPAQDAQTFIQGVSPAAMAVLKKWIPELGPVWDALSAKQRGGAQPGAPGAQPGNGAASSPSGNPASAPGQTQAGPMTAGQLAQPKTRLSAMS